MTNPGKLSTKIEHDALVNDSLGPEFTEDFRDSLDRCAEYIERTSETMSSIHGQGGWVAFWGNQKNVRAIAEHVELMTSVQRDTLSLILSLLGASVIMKQDYNLIFDSIDDLSREHKGKIEVLDYLVKIKRIAADIRDRDLLLDNLVAESEQQSEKLQNVEATLSKIQSKLNIALGSCVVLTVILIIILFS